MRIAFDTQVLSYFRSANQPGYDPGRDSVAHVKQKVAAFCIWLYVGDPIIVPTAFSECSAISDGHSKREHFTWNAYQFREVPASWLNAERVARRTEELNRVHSGRSDCQIVAECEEPAASVDVLASSDETLRKHLAAKATIRIATPFQCLRLAGLRPDSTPRLRLLPEHPHITSTWWKIDHVMQTWDTDD